MFSWLGVRVALTLRLQIECSPGSSVLVAKFSLLRPKCGFGSCDCAFVGVERAAGGGGWRAPRALLLVLQAALGVRVHRGPSITVCSSVPGRGLMSAAEAGGASTGTMRCFRADSGRLRPPRTFPVRGRRSAAAAVDVLVGAVESIAAAPLYMRVAATRVDAATPMCVTIGE